MFRIFLIELFSSLLIAGIPLLLAFELGGAIGATEILESILPKGLIVIYFFTLSFLFGSFSWIYFRILIGGDRAKERIRLLKDILIETGSGSHGILRIAAGVLMVFPVLWYLAEPTTFNLRNGVKFEISGMLALFECCGFAFLLIKIKSKWLVR